MDPQVSDAVWQYSDVVCALADTDRHLGHLIRESEWLAYDATRADEVSAGFKFLGAFVDLGAAKQALESALAEASCLRLMDQYCDYVV